MAQKNHLTEAGVFSVGCNYWASHAGTSMWRDWRPEVVDMDLRELAAGGLEILRIFPLWPDFQPLHLLRGGGGRPEEYRFGEEPLPDDEVGQDGVSQVMLERLESFLDMCGKRKLKVIVSLITGWMSGRLFVPPALEGRNVITDPEVIMWEVRLARRVVKTFKDHSAVLAWELGNECNCMGGADRAQAWLWTAAIADAVKSVDATRPFISGMHSVRCERGAAWRIADQSELTDMLTTHPYPRFTAFCDKDRIDTISSILHATAETRLYADVGGKPAFAEELGTLGDIYGDETTVAARIRSNLFSLWAHDCRSLLWWCAYDQGHLAQAPYDWTAIERELGLLKKHGQPKKALGEFGAFMKFLKGLPFDALPPRMLDAVCVMTESLEDSWAVAFSSFILGAQAGLDFEFQDGRKPLKDSSLYLLPSLCNAQSLSRQRWNELLERVRKGASLYLSFDDAIISSFEEITGLRVLHRERRASGSVELLFPGKAQPVRMASKYRLNLEATRAKIIAAEADGNPAFTVAGYGKGKVYFLSAPAETVLAPMKIDGFNTDDAAFHTIYEQLRKASDSQKVITKTATLLGVTEHPVNASSRIVVAINYSPRQIETTLRIKARWRVTRVFRGAAKQRGDETIACAVGANESAVFEIRKR